MTPMAQAILTDYAAPKAARKFASNNVSVDVQALLLDAHAFDLTAVHDMVQPLGLKMSVVEGDRIRGMQATRLAFLPAPITWIEYRNRDMPQRHGVLLIEGDGIALGVICVHEGDAMCAVAEIALQLSCAEDFGQLREFQPHVEWVPTQWVTNMCRDIYAMLAIINSPRVIGRKQRMPHAGLQRRLAAARGMVGKYPLQTWSEVVLEVTPPVIDIGEHEARLTGGKALHFCRAHLRVQHGKLVLVSSHWRGDPALGMKQTRYRVEPPRH